VLTAVTSVIATYMTSAALPELKSWLRRRLPAPWPDRLRTLGTRIHGALGGWCKAQLKMMGIVFALLTLGFWILGVEFPILFGGLISVLDALPVLGTGTVLIPWAMTCFLQGASTRGFGLLTLYALTALGRTALEPRLVGRSLGLHPLLTLAAFYIGFRTFGVPGMILLPLLAIVVKQFMQKPAQSESR
jgi:sporulation integral membrane protein YtvI